MVFLNKNTCIFNHVISSHKFIYFKFQFVLVTRILNSMIKSMYSTVPV